MANAAKRSAAQEILEAFAVLVREGTGEDPTHLFRSKRRTRELSKGKELLEMCEGDVSLAKTVLGLWAAENKDPQTMAKYASMGNVVYHTREGLLWRAKVKQANNQDSSHEFFAEMGEEGPHDKF